MLSRSSPPRVAAVLALVAAFAGPAVAQVGDFRVLPYQQHPSLDGALLTWFTIDDQPGTLTVTGPGLKDPLIFISAPVLEPILDYQAPAELNAGGQFPFPQTAIFEAPGVPARNWRHRIQVTGLAPDTLYDYTATQGETTFSSTFRTAPPVDTARRLRFAAIADSETLVLGRTRFREWSATTPQVAGSTGRPAGTGPGRTQYFATETEGYRQNLLQIGARNPDLLIMPGDLVEGTAVEQQRRWDEFWRHNAGEYDTLLTRIPLLAAIGNNCIFNGTAAPGTNANVQYARQQWSAYFDWPANGHPQYKDLFYRVDHGPVTILTLCSVGAMDRNDDVAPPVGQDISVAFPQNLDTNRAWLTAYPFGDIPDFNVGTAQWNWAAEQLAAAREAGQIILVQFHHTPYSRGIHGSSVTSNQSGEAMRIYTPLLEQYRVAAVLAGHSEMSEYSFVDLDGDGQGVHFWDVGAAGDGLRGVEDAPGFVNPNITSWLDNPLNALGAEWVMNPHHVWCADQDEAELWSGNQLVSGGKHYGFLEIDVDPRGDGTFRVSFQYWHSFPLNAGDENFTVLGWELRPYANTVILEGPADNLVPVAGASCRELDLTGDGTVDGADLGALLALWGTTAADLNGDGGTDAADIALLLGGWGPCR
ncbi:MAG TPA: metallophosphoesterase [Phycisphaerales bacterium]|nr:metallophosphoesterase [Phycisphaerales bacterium]HMP37950.1 metallophosphoesterase [Phycisphaerales bacterium]